MSDADNHADAATRSFRDALKALEAYSGPPSAQSRFLFAQCVGAHLIYVDHHYAHLTEAQRASRHASWVDDMARQFDHLLESTGKGAA
jgi:hypothetical protein